MQQQNNSRRWAYQPDKQRERKGANYRTGGSGGGKGFTQHKCKRNPSWIKKRKTSKEKKKKRQSRGKLRGIQRTLPREVNVDRRKS